MLVELKRWFLGLLELLFDQRGEDQIEIPAEDSDDDDDSDPGDEDAEDGDEDEDEEDDEDSDEDSSRSKTVPRKRFDQVNSRAQQLEALVEAGVLIENEDGELVANPKANDRRKSDSSSGSDYDFIFKKDEVDKDSWPLVDRINKGFEHFINLSNQFGYVITSLRAENAILRDYPEVLQKESPLRKKAKELLKNDPEFKKKYKHDPERSYWAVKRASELLSGKPSKKKKSKSSKFVLGKGDGGKTGKKLVDISSLSPKELDELERQEHEGLMSAKTKK